MTISYNIECIILFFIKQKTAYEVEARDWSSEVCSSDLYYNFKLIDNSPARNTANYTVAQMFPIDYDGNNRLADGNPDMGAYEY